MSRINIKLKNTIKKALNKGLSEEDITTKLIEVGIDKDEIERIMSDMKRLDKNIFSRRIKIKPKKLEEEPIEEKPEKKKGLTERLNELDDKLNIITKIKNKSKKDRTFQLPFWQKSQLKSMIKKGRLLVFYLTENRAIKPIIAELKNNFIIINNKPYNCSVDFVFLWKDKYPAIILPEWDLNPIGTKDYYDSTYEGRRANPAATIIRMIEAKEQLNKPQLGGKAMIWIIIGVIVIAYLIFGGIGGG